MDIEKVFDTIVTADRITSGKPDPMCYLLAARDLQVEFPENVSFSRTPFPEYKRVRLPGCG